MRQHHPAVALNKKLIVGINYYLKPYKNMNLKFLSWTKGHGLVMLFTVLLLTLAPNAKARQVEQSVKLSGKTLSVQTILDEIQQQCSLRFVYNKKFAAVDKVITLQSQEATIKSIFAQINAKAGLSFTFSGNQVIVKETKPGSIQGTVRTSDGKPAPYVTVSINSSTGTIVDQSGNFRLKNIPEGTYQLTASIIGMETVTREVVVHGDKTASIDLTLNETRKQLNEVVVSGEKQNKFAAKESDYIARLPISNLENPQVYNVVTNAIIKERTVTNYAEIFYNTPAVTPPSITYSNGNEFFLRGFYSSFEFRDGLSNYAGETEDPVNIERVEVLKGPSATLFGTSNGSFGGIINNVTKVPFEVAKGEVSYTGGSFGLSRLTLDYNTPVNKDSTLLFRINGARHWENSFQDFGFKHTYTVAPSILYKVNDRLTVRLSAEFYQQNSSMWQWVYFGPEVTIRNVKDLKVPYDRSSAGDQLAQNWSSSRVFAKIDYKLSDHWTSSTNFAENIYYRKASYYMNGNAYINDSTLTRFIMGAKPQSGTMIDFQQNFTGDFKIGSMRNRIVLGIDITSDVYNSTFTGAYQDTVIMNDPHSKVNVSAAKILDGMTWDPSDNHYVNKWITSSAYVSDVINVTDKLLAMLSLRVDHFNNKNSVNNGITQTDGYKQTALSPKFGIVYQLIKNQVSLFGNYMNGFSNNAPQTDGTKSITYKPSQANQWEFGIKSSLFDNVLSATLSYYNIDVKNALRTIPSSTVSIQDGTQKSKGIEIELISNPLAGLNIMAGYGYNDSRYINANNGQNGKLIGSPMNIANFYASYKIATGRTSGLGISFGGNYVGESTYNDPVLIPAYFICNTQVMYDRPKIGLSFKINNLGDEKYWSWNFIQSQPGRNYVASVTYKF